MKDTKRSFVQFEFYDRTGIEKYLEKQAEKGWLLIKTSSFGWKFRRIEPAKIHFAVTYYPKASAFDPEPSEEQVRFQEFCEYTGWKLAASNAQMQIFYNEDEDPTPIETEALIEVENIHKAAKKSYLPSLAILFACGLLQVAMFSWRLSMDPLWVLGSNTDMFAALCWIMVIAVTSIEIIGYFRWYKRGLKAAEEDGVFVETKSHTNVHITILVFMLLGLACLILSIEARVAVIAVMAIAGVLVLTAAVVGISAIMKKWKVSAKANRVLTVVLTLVMSMVFTGLLLMVIIGGMEYFIPEKEPVETYELDGWTHEIYHDDLPLIIEDLMDIDYDSYSYEMYEHEESVFLEKYEASQTPRIDELENPDLIYIVTEVKVPALYKLCENMAREDFVSIVGMPEDDSDWETHVEIDARPWGANKAYQLSFDGDKQNKYLLCYDRNIVEIRFPNGWNVTEEQKSVVGEKLGA